MTSGENEDRYSYDVVMEKKKREATNEIEIMMKNKVLRVVVSDIV